MGPQLLLYAYFEAILTTLSYVPKPQYINEKIDVLLTILWSLEKERSHRTRITKQKLNPLPYQTYFLFLPKTQLPLLSSFFSPTQL